MRALDDARLLIAALGLDAEAQARLRDALAVAGGLPGVWTGGGEALGLEPEPSARLEAVLELAVRLTSAPAPPAKVEGPEDVVALLGPRVALSMVEELWAVMLDARGGVLATRCVARGTLDACLVHPREVFAPALRLRAASLVAVHNHPSGSLEPSPEDVELTVRLAEAGRILGVPLLDHVVMARGGFVSLGGGDTGPTADRLRAGVGAQGPGASRGHRPSSVSP